MFRFFYYFILQNSFRDQLKILFNRWFTNCEFHFQIKLPLSMVDLAQTITEWKDVEGNKVRQCEPNNNKKLAQLYKAEVENGMKRLTQN